MKIGLTYCFLLAAGLSYASSDLKAADWLDRQDQHFERIFQQSDAAFDKAMKEGVAELDQELAAIWGESRLLPQAKVWIGYSHDKKTRIIVDYERGEMSLEGFETEEKDLLSDFQGILLEDNQKLDERAALKQKLIEKTNTFWSEFDDEDLRTERRKKRPRTYWKSTEPETESPQQDLRKRELSALVAPRIRPKFVKRSVAYSKGRMASLSRLTIPLRKDRDNLSAQALQAPIRDVARKYDLPRSLILSVIKNESAFNPRARSHANALGLMQLVPTSGGKEAYSFLLGKTATPSPEVLYNPVENIRLGATYLHLLNTRYFGKVKNPKTRQYLIIAAYNTGAGNVAKAFTGKMKLKAAIKKINQMAPDQVFEHLRAHLPYAETKNYLARVAGDINTFKNWDDRA